MVFKPENKNQGIGQCHNFKDFFLLISLSSESFVNIVLSRAKNNKLQRWDNISLKLVLFDLLWCQKSIS